MKLSLKKQNLKKLSTDQQITPEATPKVGGAFFFPPTKLPLLCRPSENCSTTLFCK